MKRFVLAAIMLAIALPAYAQLGTIQQGLSIGRQIEDLVLTEQEEREIGVKIADRLRARFGVVQSAAVHQYVSTVGSLAARQSERPQLAWVFTVLDTEGVNAFAAPGGFIFVTKGLLGLLQNEAELTAVLSHEVGHVAHRHSVNALKKSKGVDLASNVAVDNRSQLLGLVTNKLYSNILENKFDRNDEMDSDRQSVTLTTALKYQPDAMAPFLETLNARNKQQAATEKKRTGLFSSHPEIDERIAAIRAATKSAAKGALMRERFAANISFNTKPLGDVAIVEAPQAGAIGTGGTGTPPPAEVKKEEEPKKGGFGGLVRRGTQAVKQVVPGNQSTAKPDQELAVIDSGGTRGVDADRYAVGGPDPMPVEVTITDADLTTFAAAIR